jgi:hypothetical protein
MFLHVEFYFPYSWINLWITVMTVLCGSYFPFRIQFLMGVLAPVTLINILKRQIRRPFTHLTWQTLDDLCDRITISTTLWATTVYLFDQMLCCQTNVFHTCRIGMSSHVCFNKHISRRRLLYTMLKCFFKLRETVNIFEHRLPLFIIWT